jgi:hypothetical protein
MPTPRQQLRVSFIGGRSTLDEEDDDPGPNTLDTARNNTFIGNVQWRYTPSPAWTMSQQLYVVDASYRNVTTAGSPREEGSDSDLTWRGSVERTFGTASLIEIGGQAQALGGERVDRTYSARGVVTNLDARRSFGSGAAWAHYRWMPGASLSLAPGIRVERFGLARKTVASPWMLAEWQASPAWRLRGSAGVQYQSPTVDQDIQAAASPLRPERAVTTDLGVERTLGDAWRLGVNVYYRRERDRLRFEHSEARREGNLIVLPRSPVWANALDGSGGGAIVTVERRRANGISGWISYSYGTTDLDDRLTGESFVGDYDQAHAVNAYGIYRTSGRLSFSSRFRYGSNFPLQGYFEPVAGELYSLTDVRNTTRLPVYARLDARADWAFTYGRSRLTLFFEVMNLLNRDNYGPDDPGIALPSGLVFGATQTGFPLLPSAGVLIEF